MNDIRTPTSPRPRIAFVVNGAEASAMGDRAKRFAAHLADRFDIAVAYRSGSKLASIRSFVRFLGVEKPALTYVFDPSYSGVIAAWIHRTRHGNRVIVDTGDAIYELVRSSGSRGKLGQWLTFLLEKLALHMADHVVVRGTFHKQILDDQEIPCSVIQDGVETDLFAPRDERDFRRRIGVVDEVTIGLIGSSSWSPRLQICYGWELVEVLRLLKDKRIKGIMVGDGSGIEILRQRAREYGIEDKMIFLGRLALERLPEALGAMDICLSTQTNNIAGRVRTTGKLPIYMAAGRFILASRVGEASLVLPDEMLVDFTGERDPEYPAKIAERVCEILKKPSMLQMGGGNIDIARARFDYRLLAARLGDIIDHVLRGTLPARGEVPFEKRR